MVNPADINPYDNQKHAIQIGSGLLKIKDENGEDRFFKVTILNGNSPPSNMVEAMEKVVSIMDRRALQPLQDRMTFDFDENEVKDDQRKIVPMTKPVKKEVDSKDFRDLSTIISNKAQEVLTPEPEIELDLDLDLVVPEKDHPIPNSADDQEIENLHQKIQDLKSWAEIFDGEEKKAFEDEIENLDWEVEFTAEQLQKELDALNKKINSKNFERKQKSLEDKSEFLPACYDTMVELMNQVRLSVEDDKQDLQIKIAQIKSELDRAKELQKDQKARKKGDVTYLHNELERRIRDLHDDFINGKLTSLVKYVRSHFSEIDMAYFEKLKIQLQKLGEYQLINKFDPRVTVVSLLLDVQKELDLIEEKYILYNKPLNKGGFLKSGVNSCIEEVKAQKRRLAGDVLNLSEERFSEGAKQVDNKRFVTLMAGLKTLLNQGEV